MRPLARYVLATVNDRLRTETYRTFVTDALAAFCGADVRYHDFVNPRPDFDADAIVDMVAARAGLEVEP